MFWVAPIAAVISSLLLLWVIGRRVKGLGMRPTWTGAAFLWFLTGIPMFAMGTLGVLGTAFTGRFDHVAYGLISPPVTIVFFLLTFIAFLWRAEPDDVYPDDAGRQTALTVAAVAAAHVTILHAGPALTNLGFIPFLGLGVLLRPVFELLRLVGAAATLGLPRNFFPLIYWIDFAVFSSALAYVLTHASDGRSPPDRPSVVQRASLPPRTSFGRRRG
jgi:hypothetical protein